MLLMWQKWLAKFQIIFYIQIFNGFSQFIVNIEKSKRFFNIRFDQAFRVSFKKASNRKIYHVSDISFIKRNVDVSPSTISGVKRRVTLC